MILLTLHLRNFLSYADMPTPLNLEQVTIACLSGPNGHGKSALLDAITWSLWGKARGCEGGQEQERLIRDGADAMRVEFSFALEGQTYRVARARWRNGKGDITFNVRAADGSWTDLAGEGIADTQRRIIQRLRMDYETFVASAFILQGRADTFTRLDPKDRKAVLGKILGLETYERLAERAKLRRKETASQAQGLAQAVSTLDSALAERSEVERLRDVARASLAESEIERTRAESEAARVARDVAELRAVEAASVEARKRLEEAGEALAREESTIVRLEHRMQELAGQTGVGAKVAELAERRPDLEQEEARAEDARRRYEELTGEATSLEARLAHERSRLEADAARHEQTINRVERDLASEPEARAVLEKARTQLASLDAAATQREALLQRHAEIRERVGALDAERSRRDAERAETQEKLSLLRSARAGCPVCGQDLTPAHRKEVRAGFAARLNQLEVDDRAAATEQRALAAESATIEKDGRRLREAIERRATIAEQAAALAERIDQYAARKVEGDAAAAALAETTARLRDDDYAHGEREKLAQVRRDLEAVAFDRSSYDELKRLLAEARHAERAVSAAAAATAALETTRTETQAAAVRADAARAVRARAAHDVATMGERLVALPALIDQLDAAEHALRAARTRAEDAGRSLAAAEASLVALAQKAAEAAELRAELQTCKRTSALYEKLTKIFGRDGIPARIVGNAIPELRHEANRLLGLLTDGRLSVSIDPIRETKSRGLKETLEVTVFDAAGGKRPYEMYSGGERLRIDFALRVALSRLLASRAGSRLEMLVIDEGFGSQDAEGRQRLLEAILKVRSEFRTVLVVTHIEELKEHFPLRLEVRKDPDAGSQVTVV